MWQEAIGFARSRRQVEPSSHESRDVLTPDRNGRRTDGRFNMFSDGILPSARSRVISDSRAVRRRNFEFFPFLSSCPRKPFKTMSAILELKKGLFSRSESMASNRSCPASDFNK